MLTGSLVAHEIDSLYVAFLTSRGENALRLANEIMAMAGDTVEFTAETSSESMNGQLLKTLIFWHFDRDEMVEVINYSNKATEHYEQSADLFNLAGCYNTLGLAYQRIGQFEEAIDNYNRCNEIMSQCNEAELGSYYYRNIRYTTNNMASIYASMGEFDRSEEMYVSCINMMGELKDDRDYQDMASYLQNLADVYLQQSETIEGQRKKEIIGKAIDLSEQALDYSLMYNDLPRKVVQRRMVVACAYQKAGREKEAWVMLGEALKSAEAEENLFLQASVESLYGRFHLFSGKYHDSEAHFKKAIAMAKEGGFEECLLNAYKGACDAARHFDGTKALEYLEQSVAIKDSIFSEKQQALIRDYQVKYDLAAMEHQLEIQEKNNRTQAAEVLVLFVFAVLLVIIMAFLVGMIRARKKQNETLKRLNETQNRILSVASHDVKNSVIAQNMVLKLANEHFDHMDRDELKEKLAALKVGSDELKDKLYTILHWIYGELGMETIPSATFNLLHAVEECIKPHSEELKVKELVVVKNIAPNLQCHDKVNVFNIVFQNLLTNAIKFSKKGGDIIVSAIEDDRQIWVEVADHGVGISQQRMRELAHEMVKSTDGTLGEQGTGIGLFVSRQMMVRNGGQLIIDSEDGHGTTIKFNMKKN